MSNLQLVQSSLVRSYVAVSDVPQHFAVQVLFMFNTAAYCWLRQGKYLNSSKQNN
jgi:hypothetical protein